MNDEPSTATPTSPRVSRVPVTLDDLTAHLLWPELWKVPKLALAPGRLGLSAALLVMVFGLDHLWQAAFGGPAPGPLTVLLIDMAAAWQSALSHLIAGEESLAGYALLDLFIRRPAAFAIGDMGQAGLARGLTAALILAPIALVAASVLAGAVSRSVAREFGQNLVEPWTRSLGFSLGRWRSMVGAAAGPLVLAWALCGLLWVAGKLLLSLPGLNVVGGLIFPVFLLGGLVIALMLAAYALGQGLLLPAVACDGADAFDAVQRAYGYVFGKPLRLLLYQALALAIGAVAIVLLQTVIMLLLALLGHILGVPIEALRDEARNNPGWTARASAWLIQFWVALVQLGVAAYVVSLYCTAQTIVYLLVRRLNDGLDTREVTEG